MTKIQAMKALEAKGLSFTANVIMNGCGKPTKKMTTILELISKGFDVRHAQFETCAVVVGVWQIQLGVLDGGVDAVKAEIIRQSPGNDYVAKWVSES